MHAYSGLKFAVQVSVVERLIVSRNMLVTSDMCPVSVGLVCILFACNKNTSADMTILDHDYPLVCKVHPAA